MFHAIMIDQGGERVDGVRCARPIVEDMQLERWGFTFSTWPVGGVTGVLNGAPVDLRVLEREAARVRPGVGEGVHDWQEIASSMCTI